MRQVRPEAEDGRTKEPPLRDGAWHDLASLYAARGAAGAEQEDARHAQHDARRADGFGGRRRGGQGIGDPLGGGENAVARLIRVHDGGPPAEQQAHRPQGADDVHRLPKAVKHKNAMVGTWWQGKAHHSPLPAAVNCGSTSGPLNGRASSSPVRSLPVPTWTGAAAAAAGSSPGQGKKPLGGRSTPRAACRACHR